MREKRESSRIKKNKRVSHFHFSTEKKPETFVVVHFTSLLSRKCFMHKSVMLRYIALVCSAKQFISCLRMEFHLSVTEMFYNWLCLSFSAREGTSQAWQSQTNCERNPFIPKLRLGKRNRVVNGNWNLYARAKHPGSCEMQSEARSGEKYWKQKLSPWVNIKQKKKYV